MSDSLIHNCFFVPLSCGHLGGRNRDTRYVSRHTAAARAQMAVHEREERSAGSAVEAKTRQGKDV